MRYVSGLVSLCIAAAFVCFAVVSVSASSMPNPSTPTTVARSSTPHDADCSARPRTCRGEPGAAASQP